MKSLVTALFFMSCTGLAAKPHSGYNSPLDIKTGERTCTYQLSDVSFLAQHEITTRNTWRSNRAKFTGPLLRDVIESCHKGKPIKAVKVYAINDYSVTIPAYDFRFGVILAAFENEQPIPKRGKGPYWIIYPVDQFPELKNLETDGKMIWQVKTIEVVY